VGGRGYRIALVTFLHPGRSDLPGRLFPLIDTLRQVSEELFLVSGFALIRDDDRCRSKLEERTGGGKPSLWSTAVRLIVLGEIATSLRLAFVVKSINYVVFFHFPPLVLPPLVARLRGAKSVFLLSGSGRREVLAKIRNRVVALPILVVYRSLEVVCYSLVDRVAVLSEGMIGFLGLDDYRHKTIVFNPLCVDTELFRVMTAWEDRPFVVGFVGRLSPEKGVMNFIEAMTLVLKSRRDVSALIVGDGVLREDICRRLRAAGAEESITVTGWVPQAEVARFLNGMKLVVFPSYSEGLPKAIGEAMACGTPVLATPVGGVPDIVIHGRTGLILRDNSPEQIAECVLRALDSGELAAVSRNARAFVEERFSPHVVVRRVKSELDGLRRGAESGAIAGNGC